MAARPLPEQSDVVPGRTPRYPHLVKTPTRLILTTPDQLPANLDDVPDNALVSAQIIAVMINVKPSTVSHLRGVTARKIRDGEKPEPKDLPMEAERIGNAPFWPMGTARSWIAARPGRGGPGRAPGTAKPRERLAVRLPFVCPCGCGYLITGKDFALIPPGQRDRTHEIAPLDSTPIPRKRTKK